MQLNEYVILTINFNESANQDIKQLFNFVGENTVTANNDNWMASVSKDNQLYAIAIDCSEIFNSKAKKQDTQSIQSIKVLLTEISQFNSQLPVIIMGFEMEKLSQTFKDNKTILHQVVCTLDEGFKYPDLISALHLCQLCNNEQPLSIAPQGFTKAFRSMVGQTPQMAEVRKLIEQVSTTEANVLIMGESGTGKEVVARNLHYLSHRKEAPFVPVNCGAIPPDLLESELFGHEKGAFTGAISARQGRFELAQGGTLFLDEIGDMPMPMQVKLLRVIQERTFERVGGSKVIKADVRIVAATHRDLEQAVENGDFREDLFYRLNVFPIDVPPLRDRVEDLPLLINELGTRLQHEGRKGIRFTAGALQSLCQHQWPGNVRELANLVERMAILMPFGVADVNDLPVKYIYQEGNEAQSLPPLVQSLMSKDNRPVPTDLGQLPKEGMQLKQHLAELEKNFIIQSLERNDAVVARAAEDLGMRRTTLVEKMRKYHLSKD